MPQSRGGSNEPDLRRTEEARLIKVWREAEALETARNAKPLDPEEAPTPEEMEKPMDLKVVETYNVKFFQLYGFQLSHFEILWSHLLGRISKELKSKNFEVIHIDRVGTLRESGRSKATRRLKLATDVSIPVITTSAAMVRDVSLNYIYFQLLEVLLVGGYALLGTFDVPGKGRWCSLQAMRDYLVYVRNRCCPTVGDPPDLGLVRRSDEATRADWAVELRKGETLDRAVEIVSQHKQAAHWLWSAGMEVEQVRSLVDGRASLPGGIQEEGQEDLDGGGGAPRGRQRSRQDARGNRGGRGNQGGSDRSRSRAKGGKGAKSGGKGSRGKGNKGSLPKGGRDASGNRYATQARSGRKFCVLFNRSPNGCVLNNCPRNEVHNCNLILSTTGRACGAAHRACEHGRGGA